MKISARFLTKFLGFLSMLALLAPLTVFAQSGELYVVVAGRKLQNVVTVAKAGGNFTDPVAAVNSIADASDTNPYLVVIGPGVYTLSQTLVMKPYVDIAGSGELVTTLTGAISANSVGAASTIVSGTSNCELSSLTIKNTGGHEYSIGLYFSGNLRVSNVTASGTGGTVNNYGIYGSGAASTLTEITASASGGATSVGIAITAVATMTGVTATASGGTNSNYGVSIVTGIITMNGVSATASGAGATNYGVSIFGSPSVTMTNALAKGSGGANSYGLHVQNGGVLSTVVVRGSFLSGSTDGLYILDVALPPIDHVFVNQSGISGGVAGATSRYCVACDNGSGGALNGSCN